MLAFADRQFVRVLVPRGSGLASIAEIRAFQVDFGRRVRCNHESVSIHVNFASVRFHFLRSGTWKFS